MTPLNCSHTNGPVYLLGESLGTGVAAHLAGTYPTNVAGVLLIAPYNRSPTWRNIHMPIVPVRWLLRDRFPSEEYPSAVITVLW